MMPTLSPTNTPPGPPRHLEVYTTEASAVRTGWVPFSNVKGGMSLRVPPAGLLPTSAAARARIVL
ncbi:hypothetical protein TRAPUB_7203 [Trametes pubescens]|uniref:Uncharacterized protein n=1 Tax=Trametes pubescens TaxID=154538 RepID=A0A1M2V406_TRAPU|nr:hypothetical protein TRAPUB_7203 [Trametes pubescens]